MGFDILSNVASDIIIEETASDTCVNEVLLSTLTASISSDDRFQVHICSLNFIYSEKATKIWRNLQILFEITNQFVRWKSAEKVDIIIRLCQL